MDKHEEYKIRKHRLDTLPAFKNYKEGYYKSPGGKVISTVVSYEAEMINITEQGANWSSSIYPAMWDVLMSEWTYLGSRHEIRSN